MPKRKRRGGGGSIEAQLHFLINNTDNNGDVYSALTQISTTHFTIAMYK